MLIITEYEDGKPIEKYEYTKLGILNKKTEYKNELEKNTIKITQYKGNTEIIQTFKNEDLVNPLKTDYFPPEQKFILKPEIAEEISLTQPNHQIISEPVSNTMPVKALPVKDGEMLSHKPLPLENIYLVDATKPQFETDGSDKNLFTRPSGYSKRIEEDPGLEKERQRETELSNQQETTLTENSTTESIDKSYLKESRRQKAQEKKASKQEFVLPDELDLETFFSQNEAESKTETKNQQQDESTKIIEINNKKDLNDSLEHQKTIEETPLSEDYPLELKEIIKKDRSKIKTAGQLDIFVSEIIYSFAKLLNLTKEEINFAKNEVTENTIKDKNSWFNRNKIITHEKTENQAFNSWLHRILNYLKSLKENWDALLGQPKNLTNEQVKKIYQELQENSTNTENTLSSEEQHQNLFNENRAKGFNFMNTELRNFPQQQNSSTQPINN